MANPEQAISEWNSRIEEQSLEASVDEHWTELTHDLEVNGASEPPEMIQSHSLAERVEQMRIDASEIETASNGNGSNENASNGNEKEGGNGSNANASNGTASKEIRISRPADD